jgi:hypothetical protein
MKGDELDRILNDALASYTAREPRVGFSARTMARVQAESPKPQWNWLSFATAAVALTSLAATVMMWRNETPAPVRAPVIERVPVVPAIRTVESPQVIQRPPLRDRLTAEQRALLVFAKQAPEAALQLAQPDKPLEIEALNIPPLQIDGIEIGEIK